jgi:O-antigen/teichoic acid export membrane protein
MTLRNRVFQAVRWTALSAVFRGILQFFQLAVLARMLLPVEFGLVATTAAIVSIGSLVADLGLNSAYLQARGVDTEQRSALYWLNVLSGLFLTLLFISVSPLAEYILGDSRISTLLRIYSPVFLIVAVGLQLRYDAEKRLDFRTIAVIEMIASMSGVSVATISAVKGNGAASIIYGALTSAAVNTTLCWLFLSNGWRPELRIQLRKVNRFLGFGLAVIGNGLVTQLSTSLDMLIGGRLLGANEFGLYAAPRNLFLQVLSLINPIVTRVGFPLVAHLHNDRDRVSRLYRQTLEAIVGISAPIYLGSAVFAEPLVFVVFGERWIEAVPAFRVLALWALCRSVMNPLGNLLLGMGRPGLALKWNLVQLLLAAALLPLASGQHSLFLSGVMLALILAQLLPGWYFFVRPLCGMELGVYIWAILRPLAVSVAAVVSAALLLKDVSSAPLHLGLAVLVTSTIHLIYSWLVGEVWLKIALEQLGIKLLRFGK